MDIRGYKLQINELKELESDGRAEWKNRTYRLEEVLREFYSFMDSLASYFASKHEKEIALTIRTHRKRIKEKLDARSAGQTEKKEYECPYCHELIKFRRKYKSDDEDIIYEFYCPKCKKKIKGGYPDSFLRKDSEGEKSIMNVRFDFDGNIIKDSRGKKERKDKFENGDSQNTKDSQTSSKLLEPSPCCERCIRMNETSEYCKLYTYKCPYYKLKENSEPAGIADLERLEKALTEPEKNYLRHIEYIEKKAIFVSTHYYPCNVVDCPVKQTVLSYEGNNYCMKHFLEIIIDDVR